MDEVTELEKPQEPLAVELAQLNTPENKWEQAKWKTGQSGNPKGRGKGVTGLAKMLRREMSVDIRRTYIQRILEVACNPEHREWMNAVRLVWDRRDGPIVREMAITSGIPSVSFEVHLNAPGPRTLPALPVANEQRVIDVTQVPPST